MASPPKSGVGKGSKWLMSAHAGPCCLGMATMYDLAGVEMCNMSTVRELSPPQPETQMMRGAKPRGLVGLANGTTNRHDRVSSCPALDEVDSLFLSEEEEAEAAAEEDTDSAPTTPRPTIKTDPVENKQAPNARVVPGLLPAQGVHCTSSGVGMEGDKGESVATESPSPTPPPTLLK